MSSHLQAPKQRMGRAIAAMPNKKREKSEASLLLALTIGAFAAAGIIIVANSDGDQTLPNAEPTVHVDGRR